MSSYLLPPIIYLDSKDFTSAGNLKAFKDKTCIVMVQANWCGACKSAKPAYQSFASKNKNVVCLTIEEDSASSDNSERLDLVKKLKPSFEGFPDYLLFKKGTYVDKEINGRTEASLEEFSR